MSLSLKRLVLKRLVLKRLVPRWRSLHMRTHRFLRLAAPLLLAGLVLAPEPSAARHGHGYRHGHRHAPRVIRHHRVRLDPVPVAPPPVLFRDYLPRNHNVPMYNEPPRRGPAW
ncbi:hypothetical protein [Methylobacterium mesophilicum]|nr:hypothetical protein [Methylobacterium mesophilicum]